LQTSVSSHMNFSCLALEYSSSSLQILSPRHGRPYTASCLLFSWILHVGDHCTSPVQAALTLGSDTLNLASAIQLKGLSPFAFSPSVPFTSSPWLSSDQSTAAVQAVSQGPCFVWLRSLSSAIATDNLLLSLLFLQEPSLRAGRRGVGVELWRGRREVCRSVGDGRGNRRTVNES
jgi:hypothetical protein